MDDATLLLVESVVAALEAQRGASDALTQQMRDIVAELRAQPVPVHNVDAPVVNVTMPEQPAPVVNVTMPDRQRVDIVSMPKARILVTRDKAGRIVEMEVL